MLYQFAGQKQKPPPGARVVYVDGGCAHPNPNPHPHPHPHPNPNPSPNAYPKPIPTLTLTLALTLTKVVVAAHPGASRECRRRLSGRARAAPAITRHPTPGWGDSAPSAGNGLNGTASRTRDADVTISCEIAPVQKPL